MLLQTWILLTYKIPREPTAPRVSVWRKLKRMGALLLHDTVWVLPATPQTRENFQWLASEILEGGYEAMLWEAQLSLPGQDATLREQFLAYVDGEYEAILDALDRGDADPALLARRYQQVNSQDYLHSGRGLKAREALLHAARRAPR
jgi:hypothetical protein